MLTGFMSAAYDQVRLETRTLAFIEPEPKPWLEQGQSLITSNNITQEGYYNITILFLFFLTWQVGLVS